MKIRDEVLKIVEEAFADGGTSGVPNDYRNILLENLQKYFDQLEREICGKTDLLEVHIVNTAEYANGGEEFYVVFSDRAEAVKRFLKDFSISDEDAEFKKQDSVQQTL